MMKKKQNDNDANTWLVFVIIVIVLWFVFGGDSSSEPIYPEHGIITTPAPAPRAELPADWQGNN